MRTRCQYHCCECHQHFTSLSAFDAHRRGSHQEGTRYCVDALDDEQFLLKTDAGTCDIKPPYQTGVRLWQLKADVEALSRSGFRGSRPPRASGGGTDPETVSGEGRIAA